MTQMSEPQWREFVMTGTRTGKLAVTRGDGRPHVTPVWFVLDGDDLVFNTAETGVKGTALRRELRAALCVDDQQPPYSFVSVEGGVTLSGDAPEVLRWATTIGVRYMGAQRGAEFGARNAVPGELLVRLHADKVIAMSDVSD